jgi:3-dehydroquinate synthase
LWDVRRRGPRQWSIATNKHVGYEVHAVGGVFDAANPALLRAMAATEAGARRFVAVDSTVDGLYGERIAAYFEHHRVAATIVPVEVDERRKTMATVTALVDQIDRHGIERHEPILAVGGGVLLDVVGMTASLYRRGTAHVRVPTTLVGLVDAGIGVKCGVNHDRHKNRLGAYHPPRTVLLDRGLLATLDRRHVANGLAEIVKIALVRDCRLFELLVEQGPRLLDRKFQDEGEEVLDRAVTGMVEELGGNLWETSLERLVDFGHAVSPLVEMLALPELLHGEAVAIDMALFTVLACHRGLISVPDRGRVLDLLRTLELPVTHELLEPSVLRDALAEVTRHRGGRQRLPVPTAIGAATFVNDVTESELVLAAKELEVLR